MKIPAPKHFTSIASENRASLPVLASMLTLVVLLALFTVPAAHAQTYSVIHNFGLGADGNSPTSGVTIKGNALLGTTDLGGNPASPMGTAYQLTHVGQEWKEQLLAFFYTAGQNPQARPVFGPDGRLYGTAWDGSTYNGGSVYRLTPPLSFCASLTYCFWRQEVLHSFKQDFSDGFNPTFADLVWDQQGNMYGTTPYGGTWNQGTVYQLTKSGSTWTETLLHVFFGADGAQPHMGVVLDSNGNLFGTTQSGGAQNLGIVFELKYVVGTGWTETILHSFQGGADGGGPLSGLTWDASGNLYGATTAGTIFELSPSGNSWNYQIIYTIPNAAACGPQASLTIDSAGSLYGTTYCAGANSLGNVFKLTHTGNGWQYVSLHDFAGGADGWNPWSNVSVDTDGSLYGTTQEGGMYGGGTVWQIKP